MRVHVPCAALGLTLAAAVPGAHAQTVYNEPYYPQPVVVAPATTAVVAPTPPLRTVHTVTTTTTTRAVRRPLAHRRVAVTRHAYVPGRAARATTTTTTIVATAPAPYDTGPIYNVAAPPATVEPYDTEPHYDTVAEPPGPASIPADAAAAGVPIRVVPAYRYVYQEDRILVIDPNTGIAVEAIPR